MIKRAIAVIVVLVVVALAILLAQPSRYDKQELQLNAGSLSYKTAGTGEVVILLHGFAAEDYQWEMMGLFSELAKTYRVIIYDARGHGSSFKPTNEGGYGLLLVEDLLTLMRKLAVDRAHLIGHSMGGLTAIKFASTYPEKTLSVISLGMGWLERGPVAEQRFSKLDGSAFSDVLKACFPTLKELTITREEFAALKSPVSVMIGTEDQNYAQTVPPLKQVRPDITVLEVEGRGHINILWWSELEGNIFSILATAGPG